MLQKRVYFLLLIFFYHSISYAKIPALDFYHFTNKTNISDLGSALQCVASEKIITKKPLFFICLKGTAIKQKFQPIDIIAFDGNKAIYWTYSKPLSKITYQQVLNDFFSKPSNQLIKKISSANYFNQCIGNITEKTSKLCGKIHKDKKFKDILITVKKIFNIDLPPRILQVEKIKTVTPLVQTKSIDLSEFTPTKIEQPSKLIKINREIKRNEIFKNPWLYLLLFIPIGFLFLIKKIFFNKKMNNKKTTQKHFENIKFASFIFSIERAIEDLKQALNQLDHSFDFKALNDTLDINNIIDGLNNLKIDILQSTSSQVDLNPYLIHLSNGWLLDLFRGQALISAYYPAIDNWWTLRYGFDTASLAIRDLFYQQDIQLDYPRLLAPMHALEGVQINNDMRELSKIHYIQLFFEQSNYHQSGTFPVIDIAVLGHKNNQTALTYPSELIIYNPAEWR